MSDRIKLLSDVVANQIAAGEVVVRPSSVVKEMMENSIDAGAKRIIVNSRDGGSELIQIVDDGCGLSPNDARMAFEKHATSKITCVDDIYALRSFGFRGEALASIGAVAEVELRTRQEQMAIGTSTVVKGGVFESQQPVMCDVGANFIVRNLFYNLPARKRFLEKSTTSARNIKHEFIRIALCYPDVAFELLANDAAIYNLRVNSLAGRIVDVVGKSIKHNLLEVSVQTSIVNIYGYVGTPHACKKSNNDQYLFVNGRYFRSPHFYKAILKGYEKLIAPTMNPSYFLFLEVDPERIDVNVHPQKTEIKFADEDQIWQIILAAVRESLAKSGSVPMMEFDDSSSIEIPVAQPMTVYSEPKMASNRDYNPFSDDYIDGSASDQVEDFTGFDVPYDGKDASPAAAQPSPKNSLRNATLEYAFEDFESGAYEDVPSVASVVEPTPVESVPAVASDFEVFESSVEPEPQSVELEEFESSFEFIDSPSQVVEQQELSSQPQWQSATVSVRDVSLLGGGYATAIVGADLMVVDLRRARERVLFDEIFASLSARGYVGQQLLFPESLELSLSEYELLEEFATDFALLGFDIDFGGAGKISVRAIPASTTSQSIDTLIFDLLKVCATPEPVAEYRQRELASRLAYESSMGALTMGREQAKLLVEQLVAGGRVMHTESGKSIVWSIGVGEIRKRLG